MVRQQHTNSEQFVMSLSQFYRQTLKHNEDTTLPLSEEIDVLESYLFLMKSRHGDAVFVSLQIDPALFSLHLPTLALQAVAENCFKHNSMTSKTAVTDRDLEYRRWLYCREEYYSGQKSETKIHLVLDWSC